MLDRNDNDLNWIWKSSSYDEKHPEYYNVMKFVGRYSGSDDIEEYRNTSGYILYCDDHFYGNYGGSSDKLKVSDELDKYNDMNKYMLYAVVDPICKVNDMVNGNNKREIYGFFYKIIENN